MKKTFFIYTILIIAGVSGLIFYKSDFIFPSNSGIMINLYVGLLQTGAIGFIFEFIAINNKKNDINNKRNKFISPIFSKIHMYLQMLKIDYFTLSETLEEKSINLSEWRDSKETYDLMFIQTENFSDEINKIILEFIHKQQKPLLEIIKLLDKIIVDDSTEILFNFNDIFDMTEIVLFENYKKSIDNYLKSIEKGDLQKGIKNNFSVLISITNAMVENFNINPII